MLDYLAIIGPVLIALTVYFVRLESRMTRMSTDISWIKRHITACQPPSEENTV